MAFRKTYALFHQFIYCLIKKWGIISIIFGDFYIDIDTGGDSVIIGLLKTGAVVLIMLGLVFATMWLSKKLSDFMERW
jgi:hypothetical protein